MRAIRAIVAREFAEISRNRMLLLSSLVPSLIFLIIPVILTHGGAMRTRGNNQMTPAQMNQVITDADASLADLPQPALAQIFIFRQLIVFMLILPTITSLTIATYSIIGEKQTRSLEPLLAAPITSTQLMVAKSLAAALPATGLAWVVFGLYIGTLRFTALPQVLPHVLTSVSLVLIFVICPLVAVLGLSIGVIVSSRVNDPRTAQQIGGILVLPVIALFVAQLSGLYYLRFLSVLVLAGVLFAVDVTVLAIGVALFDRETILVRWK